MTARSFNEISARPCIHMCELEIDRAYGTPLTRKAYK